MEDKVIEIIKRQLNIDEDKDITSNTVLTKDLEADSLDAVEVIMALEDEFGVEIPDEEAEKLKTVGDIVNYIKENQ